MTKIIFNNKNTIYIKDKMLSILEALEQENIKPNYQCRQGLCGSCRCILRKGKVKYKIEPFAMSKNNQEIFICIAIALGDIINLYSA